MNAKKKQVKVIVLRTAGTNCDQETAYAFSHFGAKCELVHIHQLIHQEVDLNDFHILAIPGGFTYGDNIESGRILANELTLYLGRSVERFLKKKRLVIGICNGFQVLVKAGILPGSLKKGEQGKRAFRQNSTLTVNDSAKFEDRWVYLKTSSQSVWTKNLPEIVYFPVAHAEGKFVPADKEVLIDLKKNHQIAFQYTAVNDQQPAYPENPNGSVDHIAGITDASGRVLGLMPHPERHFSFYQHPFWSRRTKTSEYGDGAKIFENGVNYIKKHL
ncbi:MAG: phosphoribosylformylglycinamidine synthase I [Candidatus Omnitrophica bacterium]|nr:phosphoribosylformylglycinamidine synthase I [Candidatus Omnitrophota bacterium]